MKTLFQLLRLLAFDLEMLQLGWHALMIKSDQTSTMILHFERKTQEMCKTQNPLLWTLGINLGSMSCPFPKTFVVSTAWLLWCLKGAMCRVGARAR
eukprot:4845198-Amphidinium_carterae.2